MNIKIIGLGGIGCSLVNSLCRFLNFTDIEASLTLIDGDSFEPRNSERQPFADYGNGNKAEKVSQHLQQAFPRISQHSIASYITEGNVVQYIREYDIIFLGVDNHASRKLVSDRCGELDNVLLISGGNEFTDGNVQIYWRKDGKDMTLPLTNQYHPEIAEPKDKNPGEAGCDELVESSPQLLFVNEFIAGIMKNCFYGYIQGTLDYDEVYADIVTNNCRQVRYNP